MNNKIKIYVSTSNLHIHMIKVFAYLFNKFWSSEQEVIVLGYDAPTFDLPNNFKFISMGKQEGIHMWAPDLKGFFESIEDKHFIYTMEDMFLVDPVNFKILDYLIDVHKLNDNIGRIGLTTDIRRTAKWNVVAQHKTFDLIERLQDQWLRISATCSLWNRNYMLEHLLNKGTPWEFEGLCR